MKVCPECGAELRDEMMVCLECGTLQPSMPEPEPIVVTEPEPGVASCAC